MTGMQDRDFFVEPEYDGDILRWRITYRGDHFDYVGSLASAKAEIDAALSLSGRGQLADTGSDPDAESWRLRRRPKSWLGLSATEQARLLVAAGTVQQIERYLQRTDRDRRFDVPLRRVVEAEGAA